MTRPTPPARVDPEHDDLAFARGLCYAFKITVLAVVCIWVGWSFLGALVDETDINAAQTSAWLAEHPGAGR